MGLVIDDALCEKAGLKITEKIYLILMRSMFTIFCKTFAFIFLACAADFLFAKFAPELLMLIRNLLTHEGRHYQQSEQSCTT